MDKNTAETLKNAATDYTNAEYDLNQAVVQAKIEGATWQQIGDAIGSTRQAAQQRYGWRVKVEQQSIQWRKENPELHAAAQERGRQAAQKDLEEIRARRAKYQNVEDLFSDSEER